MFATFSILILFFAEVAGTPTSDSAWDQFLRFWNQYLNYPGFEAWRFFNLAVFIAGIIYLAKKPVTEKFKARRELIRADLIKAEEEIQAAISKLVDSEARLAQLDSESAKILVNAENEAEAEKIRIAEESNFDIERLQGQLESEVSRKTQQTYSKLRRYSAEESVRLAELRVKEAMDIEKDSRLVKANIQSVGGAS